MRNSLQLQPELASAAPASLPDAPTAPASLASRWALPALVTLFAFVLGMLYLNHESVSGDEAFSISVSQLPLREMMRTLVVDFVHPPLHYFVLRGWLKVFGYGLFQARLLSVLFGTLAVFFLYLLAEYLVDRRTALLSALLLAASQLGIMYAQEVRPYAQFHFLALCGSYLFLRAFRQGRPLFWWSFVATAILMLYTDYFSVYLIAALLVLPLIYRRDSKLRPSWILAGSTLSIALYIPWITSGILHAAANNGKTFLGKENYAAVHWWTLFSIVNWFNNGKPAGLRSDSPWWTYVIGGLLFTAPLLLLLKKPAATRQMAEPIAKQNLVIAGILCLAPLVLILGAGKILHIPYNVRYVSFCAAFYYILVARAVLQIPFNALRWCLVVLILAYSANSLRANYFMRWKEHWAEAFAYVAQNRHPGDCGVFLPDFEVPPQWPITQAGRPSFRTLPPDNVAAELPGCTRVWEVSWAPRDDFRWLKLHEAGNTLLATTLNKTGEQHYYGVNVALYSKAGQ
jgi:4-amino-4-deoxy-L-arabinose transferase-like glycosyltransferase